MIAEKSMGITPQNTVRGKDFVWLDAKKSPFKVYGVYYDPELNRYMRMPLELGESISAGAKMLCDNTSGGRVRFRTNAKEIAISATQKNTVLLPHIPLCSQSGFDIYSGKIYKGTFMPKMNIKNGYAAAVTLDGEWAEYTINFPLYDNVYELYIGFNEGAEVLPPKDYKHEKPIVFYGSSITQGASCSHPGNCYTSRVCRELDSNYINLGLAANCFGEKQMAEYIARLDMSVFVMDFDHNCRNDDMLYLYHRPFFDVVRSANPELPIVLMSAPDIATKKSFIARRERIKETYLFAKDSGDNKVYFLDGEDLFAGDGVDGCTVDGTHPNDLGFYRMANALNRVLKQIVKW